MTDYLARYQALAISRGGLLLSPKYINGYTKLEWKCGACSNVWVAQPNIIRRGSWCPPCGHKRTALALMADNLSRGREIAEKRGGLCLATSNAHISAKVWWECVEGHRWETTFQTVILGKKWCPKCAHVANGLACIADNLAAAHDLAAAKGGRCLATRNFPIRTKVEWECAEGHRWWAVFYSVNRGTWCWPCAVAGMRDVRIGDNLTRGRQVAAYHGGVCLMTENFATRDQARWRCAKGHEWSTPASGVLYSGTWCGQCLYKSEEYCHRVLAAIFSEHTFERNIRTLPWMGIGVGGRALELDIYNVELSLALEYNGYLHEVPNEAFGGQAHLEKIQEHDARKIDACNLNNVCLITIVESEVTNSKGGGADHWLVAQTIWDAVDDMGYPPNTHIPTFEALLKCLGLE
jgi:hypothetical protein